MPFISICIPAYKNPWHLRRLLDSIAIQTYKDFEVIITDDSPDELLVPVISDYKPLFEIVYLRNEIALGTPANWNFAISNAKGQWIKLMHDDDWFANEKSLEIFASTALNSEGMDFIFCVFNEVEKNIVRKHKVSDAEKFLLKKSPINLFKRNFIGPPSTTLVKNNKLTWYDENTKWVVDFEFYIRCLKQTRFFLIDEFLVNIGIHTAQVTKQAFRNPLVEIPENIYLLNKIGSDNLKNFFLYDYYWRLFRNLKMRNFKSIDSFSSGNKLPDELEKMLLFQFKIPLSILKIGLFSKGLMFISKIIS